MAKPIELAVVVVAVLGVGGTFLAGYLLGRGAAPASPGAAATGAAEETEDDDPEERATKRPPRRTKHRPPRAPSPEPAASSDGRAPPSAAPSEIAVRATPDADAPVLQQLGPDARFDVVERRAGWRRIEAKAADGSVVVGWIVWKESRPSSTGGTLSGGNGVIQGTTRLLGRAPEMKVPKKRKDAEVCKDQAIASNAVIVHDGGLADVLVRIARGGIAQKTPPPKEPVKIDQVGCVYLPRIQGAIVYQELEIWNSDPTLHNAHGYRGVETAWNTAQIKGAQPLRKEVGDVDIFKITCDVHPWMRAFVVFTDHPYFAVSSLDGLWSLVGVPAGTYTIEAWHARYGLKKERVTVKSAAEANVDFTFRDTDPEPPENKDELRDLF